MKIVFYKGGDSLSIVEIQMLLKGLIDPLSLVKLLAIIYAGRSREVHPNNLRVWYHTLVENGLMHKYRSRSLHLAFMLSDPERPQYY